MVSKLNHPNTAPGNRKARPIVDAEEIMKHANDKIAIEKTFPTVKPKNVQPTTPVVVDGAVDPVNSKISSIGSVEPLPDSTTLVSKLNHPSTASANRNAGPIIDGEDIMKHANEKIAIDKTFPTVKPKNVQPTIVAEVESADISSAEAAKSVIIESSNAKPIITVAPRAQESNVTPKKPSDEVLATENSDLVENGEEITQVDEALKSVVTGSSSSSTDDSTEFVDNKPNVEVITESVEVDYSVEKNAETNTQPDFEELTVAEPTTDSIANSRQEETSQTINSEIQLDDLTSIPSEEISAPIEQEIIPEAVSASTVSETTVDGTLSPTPSVVDELNEANVNYEPTETFSSSPPTADHVTLRDDKDSFDKGKHLKLILGEEVVRDEL